MRAESDQTSEAEHLEHYDSADIDERHGSVPRWLMGVYVALGIWMIYYLFENWRP